MKGLAWIILTLGTLTTVVLTQGQTSRTEEATRPESLDGADQRTPFEQALAVFDEPITRILTNGFPMSLFLFIPANGTQFPDVLITLRTEGIRTDVDIFCKPQNGTQIPTATNYVWKSDHHHGEDFLFISRFHPLAHNAIHERNGIAFSFLICTLINRSDAVAPIEVTIDLDYFHRDLVNREQRALEKIFQECCQGRNQCVPWKNHAQRSNAKEADFCHYDGNVCDHEGQLIRLNFNYMNMSCPFPIKQLTKLKTLKKLQALGNSFTGKTRDIFKDMVAFEHLDLVEISDASFSGPLANDMESSEEPVCQIARKGSILHLELTSCEISGTLPSCLFDTRSRMRRIVLRGNRLTGKLPKTMVGNSTLQSLSLAENQLSGKIPSQWTKFQNLEILFLQNNKFSGKIPEGFGSVRHLTVLDLSDNRFSGALPNDIFLSRGLRFVNISNCQLTGRLPNDFANGNQLLFLSLRNNQLTGTLPPKIAVAGGLEVLDLSQNRFSGEIPSSLAGLRQLVFLFLGHNRFSGFLPSDFKNLRRLSVLRLESNRFSGRIPQEWRLISRLWILRIDDNRLIGMIPGWMHTSQYFAHPFFEANISSNGLTGFDESWFQESRSFHRISHFYASDNNLQGEIPPMLSLQTFMSRIDLSRNALSGALPSLPGAFSSVRFMNLSFNGFTGEIPDTWSSNAMFTFPESTSMDLSYNNLTGDIPKFLLADTNSDAARKFFLAGNEFTFTCPRRNGRSFIQDLPCTRRPKTPQNNRRNGVATVTTLSDGDEIAVRNNVSPIDYATTDSDSDSSLLALILAIAAAVGFALVASLAAWYIWHRKHVRALEIKSIPMSELPNPESAYHEDTSDKARILSANNDSHL